MRRTGNASRRTSPGAEGAAFHSAGQMKARAAGRRADNASAKEVQQNLVEQFRFFELRRMCASFKQDQLRRLALRQEW